MKTARNAPCPCGSGKKYKQCHLDSDLEAARHGVDPAAAPLPRSADKTARIAAGVGLLVMVAVGLLRDVSAALVVGAAWALGQVAWMSFRDPPPVREDAGHPAALDFGRREDK